MKIREKPIECDGGCLINGDCKGDVRKVRVIGPDVVDYGCFNYCETAIEKDKANGFFVDELNEALEEE